MNVGTFVAAGISISFCLAFASEAVELQDKAMPASFPSGSEWDYPLPAEMLKAAVAGRDESRIRRHGWYLFVGANLSASNGLPIWRTWPSSTPAFAPGSVMPPPGAGGPVTDIRPSRHLIQRNVDNIPADLSGVPIYLVPASVCQQYSLKDCPGASKAPFALPDGIAIQNNGDIMLASVSYNQPAFDYIRGETTGRPLFDAATLTAILPPKGEIAELPAFPKDSFVIKHMYWPVKGGRCSALPVWDDPEPPKPDAYMGYEVWQRAVAVATKGCGVEPSATTKVSFLSGVLDGDGKPLPPRVFDDAKVVPLNAFYHQTFSQADLDALDPRDRALLDTSSMWAFGEPFVAGDSIVSIAMHIFSKEMPGWTMQTYWWHDQPDKGAYAADRPDIPMSQAPLTWRNYLMMSEYGVPDAEDPDKLPVRYNPYIELVIHPVATNCRNCHQRAGWPRQNTGLTPYVGYQTTPISSDPGLLANIGSDAEILKGLLLLDYQWAVSDRALPGDYRGQPDE